MLFILFYIQKAVLYLKLGCETEKDEDMFMLMEQFLDAVNVSTILYIIQSLCIEIFYAIGLFSQYSKKKSYVCKAKWSKSLLMWQKELFFLVLENREIVHFFILFQNKHFNFNLNF